MYEFYKYDIKLEKKNQQIGLWMKDWCKEMYNEDWNYCISLTYKFPIIKEVVSRRNLREYFRKLYEYDSQLDGFVVNELDNILVSLHHHIILKSKLGMRQLVKLTNKMWNNKGSSFIDRYDVSRELNWCVYMTKHLEKTNRNNWYIISNFK